MYLSGGSKTVKNIRSGNYPYLILCVLIVIGWDVVAHTQTLLEQSVNPLKYLELKGQYCSIHSEPRSLDFNAS